MKKFFFYNIYLIYLMCRVANRASLPRENLNCASLPRKNTNCASLPRRNRNVLIFPVNAEPC